MSRKFWCFKFLHYLSFKTNLVKLIVIFHSICYSRSILDFNIDMFKAQEEKWSTQLCFICTAPLDTLTDMSFYYPIHWKIFFPLVQIRCIYEMRIWEAHHFKKLFRGWDMPSVFMYDTFPYFFQFYCTQWSHYPWFLELGQDCVTAQVISTKP